MASAEAQSFPQNFYQPESDATQILFVRHGQSAPFIPGQPFPLVDGHGDPPLSQRGLHQAELLADRLAGEGIDAIYVSTLTRTHQTAAPLAERLGLEPIVEPDFREVYLGEAEGGLLRQRLVEGDPVAVKVAETGEWGLLAGAERSEDLAARCVGAARRVAENHRGQLVLVVCHGGVIAALLGYCARCNPTVFRGARHTSINHVVIEPPGDDPAGWTLRSYNDGAHAGTLTGDFDPPHPTPGRRISS